MRSPRGARLALAAALTVIALAGTIVLADTFTGDEATASKAPVSAAVEHPAPTTSTTAVALVRRFSAGEAVLPELAVFAEPNVSDAAVPVATLTNPTHEGFPLIVSVVDRSADGGWLLVRLPVRPNGTTGWIRASDIRASEVPNRIEVDLSEFRLRVFDGDSSVVLFDTDVAIGKDQTPTPVGDFFIDIVNPLGGHKVYGWGQLSVSGFSEVLERFAGGVGQIAIHGWNDNSVMGSAASNGCVRMRNDDIARVAELSPLGTPVRIIP